MRAYHNASGSTDRRGDSYRLGLQYELNDDVQTYFTYSRGYRWPSTSISTCARSTRTTPLDEVPLNPETSKAYEAGIKGITADRSVSYSLAIYNTDYDGYQANFNDVIAGAQQLGHQRRPGAFARRGGGRDVAPDEGLRGRHLGLVQRCQGRALQLPGRRAVQPHQRQPSPDA
ncbi:TonB-dependent receptor domain-containing protein [Sphingomonas sp. MMS24-JH45]